MNKISLADIKLALKDQRFKDSLPDLFKDDLKKWEKNPGCGCNISFYKKILNNAKDSLINYFPNKDMPSDKDLDEEKQNNFSVINCSVSDLEGILKKLRPGRKQIAASRYEDQITVILNEID